MLRRRSRLAGLLAAALLACAGAAPADADADAGAEAEARAHFGRGVELVEQRAWAEALAEFVLSRRLHPTWKATKNAAACLAELGRDDEALDLFEALLREFPELPAQTREEALAASAKLQERVGVLAVEEGEPGAVVVVDERYRGELPAAASLRVGAGAHVVRLIKDGFEPLTARVVVTGGQRAAVAGRLRALGVPGRREVAETGAPAAPARDTRASAPQGRPRLTLELDAAAFVAKGFGGDISAGCAGSCSAPPALGGRTLVRGGVELRSGLAFGLAAGALAADERTTGRATALAPVGLPPTPGFVDDRRKLRAFVGGAWGAFTFGERGVLRLRLGVGAVAGSLGDSRTGRFQPAGAAAYSIGPVGDAPRAVFVYVEPEVRGGLRVGRDVELTAGVAAMFLFDVAHPAWDAKHEVNASRDGLAFFPAETLSGPVSVAFVPGLAGRYAF